MPLPKPNVLYLSYDGMTDPLGRSQVIPYLQRLAKDYDITLISFEKRSQFTASSSTISEILEQSGISWKPLPYTKRPPVLSTVWDLLTLFFAIRKIIRSKPIRLIHCRSYLTTLMALYFRKQCKVLFDMRGFWIDERVDGKIWNTSNPLYRFIFRYLKKREVKLVSQPDAIVSLSAAAIPVIRKWQEPESRDKTIAVIPCCTDTSFFVRSPENLAIAKQTKQSLDIKEDHLTIGYLGSIGTWYMLEEMLDFFACLNRRRKSVFLFITPDNPEHIVQTANQKGIDTSSIRIIKANREQIPSLALMMDISVFFILPAFSKMASSPTKLGELMSLGIPVVCNSGIGDVDQVIEQEKCGVVIREFNTASYDQAVTEILARYPLLHAEELHQSAVRQFGIEKGVLTYTDLYATLLSK